jgi:hypothetical protein
MVVAQRMPRAKLIAVTVLTFLSEFQLMMLASSVVIVRLHALRHIRMRIAHKTITITVVPQPMIMTAMSE